MAIIARRRTGYVHDLEIDGHSCVSDEPESVGGTDQGPSPTKLLAAALASCTAITIEMYADRKDWHLGEIEVEVTPGKSDAGGVAYEVEVRLPSGLTEEQTSRILTIAAKCPVHKVIAGETPVSVSHITTVG